MLYTPEEVLESTLSYFDNDELAAKVWIDKYCLKDNEGNLLEKDPSDMHHRLAREFARIEKGKYDSRSYITSVDEIDDENRFKHPLSEELIFDLLDKFKYIIPGGSVLFGAGNPYQYISLSNCFLCDIPEDSYGDIMRIDEQIVQISKRRGGASTDLSNLRPEGFPTKNSSQTSTGIVPFMERYSNSIREVGQSGRRGALMLTLSVHHPQILDFVQAKKDTTKITGANISVKVTDEFLKAVKTGKKYEQRFPINSKNPKYSQMISAKSVWDTIIKNSWLCGEPGILLWDNITSQTPADCYTRFKSQGTNPCCFSKTQNVWTITNNGYKEIKNITKNDLIWVDYYKEFCPTSGYFDTGVKQIYRVEFDNSSYLDITKQHKLLKHIDNKPAVLTKLKNLKINDKILINCFDPITNINTKTNKNNTVSITKIITLDRQETGCLNIDKYHMFTANGIISGNSEINLSPLDSCRLLSLNTFSYIDNPFSKNASFNYTKFTQHSKIAQRLMDDIVDLESESVQRILDKIKKDPESIDTKQREIDLWSKIKTFNDEGRRTGTGVTAIGDSLAGLNIKYGNQKSIDTVGNIYKTLKLACYKSSVQMAQILGPFKDYDFSLEKNNQFLLRIKEEDPGLYKEMKKFGRRNISLTTTAPTGSLSLLTQTTAGIEPLFMLSYKRRKKINLNDNNEKNKIDYIDKNGDKWEEFIVYHHKIKEWMEKTGNDDINKSPWYGCCAEEINWLNRVKLQAEAQKHVCHSISSTINLPHDVSVNEVKNIYETASEMKCKGITVYRAGSRTGVLVDKNENKTIKKNGVKRPKNLPCDIFHISRGGNPYFVLVGLKDKQTYEVFAGDNKAISKKFTKGTVTKVKRGCYKLTLPDETELCPITIFCTDEEQSLTRMVSISLRHGVPIKYIVQQLNKSEGELSSFSKCIARALKNYIENGTKITGEACPTCNGELVHIEGCATCQSCGYSKCM